jgi:dihydrodipicolinate synthase/N-acetylneuraminate lyase
MRKAFSLGAAAVFAAFLVAQTALAQEVSKEEREMCIEAVKEVAAGKEPAAAIKLCNEGKTQEALEAAMKASEN